MANLIVPITSWVRGQNYVVRVPISGASTMTISGMNSPFSWDATGLLLGIYNSESSTTPGEAIQRILWTQSQIDDYAPNAFPGVEGDYIVDKDVDLDISPGYSDSYVELISTDYKDVFNPTDETPEGPSHTYVYDCVVTLVFHLKEDAPSPPSRLYLVLMNLSESGTSSGVE